MNLWRVTYKMPSLPRERAQHFRDKGFALRLAASYRKLLWCPVRVERVSDRTARADLKWDPFAEPLAVHKPMPLARGRVRRRSVAAYLATEKGSQEP